MWQVAAQFYIMGPGRCPKPSHHASTIVQLGPGRGFMAAWFGGQTEGFPDASIYTSVFQASEQQWSSPVQVVASVGEALWNPVLFKMPGGALYLFFKVGMTPATWLGGFKKSTDDGLTWGPPKLFPEGILGPIKNKPLLLADGTLLAPSSVETPTKTTANLVSGLTGAKVTTEEVWENWVEATRDIEHSWTNYGPIKNRLGGRTIQPSLFVDAVGNVRMLARSSTRHVVMARSDSLGQNWTEALDTTVPAPNSGMDAVKLADGRLLLVHNPLAPRGGPQRGMLSIALSPDDGETWYNGPMLENSGKEHHEFSYPAVIQAQNGLVHITYTWRRMNIKHVIVDPSQLQMAGKPMGT
ncbi:hypothetical protein CYMTET_7643 [Cymbomonas tetramitiformis]|uniref:Sialidase domain-containing protein n=1 Tax=Cymbomonas tetramitiformis TaxID=36881 RepID=A0AAE0LH92_9CHLO|nr:hypothetical protein CYMTET_7643 [Cymbomonas tetramitiformis]